MYSSVCKTSTLRFFPKKSVVSNVPAKRKYHLSSTSLCRITDGAKPSQLDNKQSYKLLEGLKFSTQDYTRLCYNSYNRFQLNSRVIGNVVIQFNGKEVKASQYAMPEPVSDTAPMWVTLRNLKKIEKLGTVVYQAESANGTLLFSNRSYLFTDWNECTYEFHPFFSLSGAQYVEPLFGNTELDAAMNAPVELSHSNFRGGQEVRVDHNSLEMRKRNRIHSRSQTDVMGLTALDAYQNFYSTHNTLFTPDLTNVFNQILNAKYRNHPLSKFYPEWHHAVGYGLSPMDREPQDKSNLGGGPQWSNTAMMVLENLCHWYASQSPDICVVIKPTFFMLFASDLIEKIHYEATVQYGARFLKFSHLIEPHRYLNPVIPQASDVAQLVKISQSILTDIPPSLNSSLKPREMKSNQTALAHEEPERSNRL